MFLKYIFLISLYFGQHEKWNSDSITFCLIAHLVITGISTYIIISSNFNF